MKIKNKNLTKMQKRIRITKLKHKFRRILQNKKQLHLHPSFKSRVKREVFKYTLSYKVNKHLPKHQRKTYVLKAINPAVCFNKKIIL